MRSRPPSRLSPPTPDTPRPCPSPLCRSSQALRRTRPDFAPMTSWSTGRASSWTARRSGRHGCGGGENPRLHVTLHLLRVSRAPPVEVPVQVLGRRVSCECLRDMYPSSFWVVKTTDQINWRLQLMLPFQGSLHVLNPWKALPFWKECLKDGSKWHPIWYLIGQEDSKTQVKIC